MCQLPVRVAIQIKQSGSHRQLFGIFILKPVCRFPEAVIGAAYAVDTGKAFVVIKCIDVDDAVGKVFQLVGFHYEDEVRV